MGNYDKSKNRPKTIIQDHIIKLFSDRLKLTCPPKKCLDLGCGFGDYSLVLAKNGSRVVAVDNSINVINQAYKHPSITYKLADLQNLKSDFYLDIKSYDKIISICSFEFLPNYIQVIEYILYNMNNDSDFLLILPNQNSLNYKIFLVLIKFKEFLKPKSKRFFSQKLNYAKLRNVFSNYCPNKVRSESLIYFPVYLYQLLPSLIQKFLLKHRFTRCICKSPGYFVFSFSKNDHSVNN